MFRKAIEQEKQVYKESCDKLRVAKSEIDHITKVVGSANRISP